MSDDQDFNDEIDYGAEDSEDSEASVELGERYLGRDINEDRDAFFPVETEQRWTRSVIREA